jgi:hypothetical protein
MRLFMAESPTSIDDIHHARKNIICEGKTTAGAGKYTICMGGGNIVHVQLKDWQSNVHGHDPAVRLGRILLKRRVDITESRESGLGVDCDDSQILTIPLQI